MVHSMTAFASVETVQPWGEATWEIRSVNHRYLDMSLRCPEAFRSLELPWRELLKSHLKRGKVECILTFKAASDTAGDLKVDEQLAKQLIKLNKEVAQLANSDRQINPFEILRWPEMVSRQAQKFDLQEPLTELLKKAVIQLTANRAREGQACLQAINERLNEIGIQLEMAKSYRPKIESDFREKMNARLEELSPDIDSNRFEQEVLMFLQRTDVAEELDRLDIHIKEVQRALKQDGPKGRRLDFLMQELNRESNTLAAKSPDPLLTQAAVELKVCIEQIREQIQNVE